MANTAYIRQFIRDRLGALMEPSPVCFYEHELREDEELDHTLQAAGHDTRALQAAMMEMRERAERLRTARDEALERFEEHGLLFSVVPLEKRPAECRDADRTYAVKYI